MDPQRYYESLFAERERLASGVGRLEFERTCDILHRVLRKPPARIMDVGGGPGIYACHFASRGYEVFLIDPVPLHVQQAAEASALQFSHPIARMEVGDARALPAADASQDAVLLLGPLYHLIKPEERAKALREARRVLKPDGVLAAAAISRHASLFDGLARGLIDDPVFMDILARDLKDGSHENPTGHPQYFTAAYFHLPEEFIQEIQACGFPSVRVFAVEGPGWVAADLEQRLVDPARREQLMQLLRQIESQPGLIGCSMHMLAIALTQ